MSAKPMGRELRDMIEAKLANCPKDAKSTGCMIWTCAEVELLLADSLYWRNAVKEADLYWADGMCPFCCERVKFPECTEGHKADCAWQLAQ